MGVPQPSTSTLETEGEGMVALPSPRWNAGASVEQAWSHTRIRMDSAWWTDRPSLVRPVLQHRRRRRRSRTDWRPRLSPEPPCPSLPSTASRPCFQTHSALFSRPRDGECIRDCHGGAVLVGRYSTSTLPFSLPDPLTRPPDCRRQAPPIPVGQSAEWPCSVHSGHRVLKLSSGRPRPPSILDGRSAYRYAVLILLPPSQSHTMAHHPGFPILL